MLEVVAVGRIWTPLQVTEKRPRFPDSSVPAVQPWCNGGRGSAGRRGHQQTLWSDPRTAAGGRRRPMLSRCRGDGGVGWCSLFTTCKQGWAGCQATHCSHGCYPRQVRQRRKSQRCVDVLFLFGVWVEKCRQVPAEGVTLGVKLSDRCQGHFIILSSMSWPFWINQLPVSHKDTTSHLRVSNLLL